MYELAYLRIFAAWEAFLEESFLRLMCGYSSAGNVHPLKTQPKPRTVQEARVLVLNNKKYKLWHDPDIMVGRVAKFFTKVPGIDVPHDAVLGSATTLLKDLSHIRHHIAHLTEDTCSKYHDATMNLCGIRFGRRCGRFLRSTYVDPATGLTARWLDRICADLKGLASQYL